MMEDAAAIANFRSQFLSPNRGFNHLRQIFRQSSLLVGLGPALCCYSAPLWLSYDSGFFFPLQLEIPPWFVSKMPKPFGLIFLLF
jgi:hypothetical protein